MSRLLMQSIAAAVSAIDKHQCDARQRARLDCSKKRRAKEPELEFNSNSIQPIKSTEIEMETLLAPFFDHSACRFIDC